METLESREEALNPPPEEEGVSYRYSFANVVFDEAKLKLFVGGTESKIQKRPRQLLGALLRHAGRTVSKERLLELVWDNRVQDDAVITTAMTKLRPAVGDAGSRHIVPVPGVGYRLEGPVTRTVAGTVAPSTSPDHLLREGLPVPGCESFRFVRPLGRAGQKHVWLARHIDLGVERVFKFATTEQQRRRLRDEFKIYTYLRRQLGDHPGLVTIVAANLEKLPCYLECEHGGQDLAEWATEGRLETVSPSERLSIFLQAADTLASAHRAGVIHRDIKPSNILISGEPGKWLVRLADFGSARAVDLERFVAAGITAMGTTLLEGQTEVLDLTPMYVAPEVRETGRTTTQSDLYALGMVLYQLLSGSVRRAIANGWEREIEDDLLVEDIAAATQGEPRERMDSVATLTIRLRSLDARREERARRAAEGLAAQRLTDELQRKRLRRPWLIALLASLTLGLVASLAFFAQAQRSLSEAESAIARAESISNFLHRDVMEATDIVTVGAKVRPQLMLETLQQASKAASKRFAGQPRAEATLRRRLAETFMKMASLIDAGSELNRAIDLLTPISNPQDQELLMARFLKARLLFWTERPAEGIALLEAAERDAGLSVLGETSEIALLATRARYEQLFGSKSYREALPLGERLVTLANALYTHGSQTQIDARQRLAELHHNLGNTPQTQALLAELEGPPFNAANSKNEFYSRQATLTGDRFRDERRYADAERAFREALDWVLRSTEPSDYYIAFAKRDIASVLEAQGKLDDAVTALNTSIAAFTRSVSEDHQYTRTTTLQLALIYVYQGKHAEALPILDAVDRWQDKKFGKRPWWPLVDFCRGVALAGVGRASEGAKILSSFTGLDVQYVSPWTDWQYRLDFHRGVALVNSGQGKDGKRLADKAIAALKQAGSWPWLIEAYQRQAQSLSAR